MIDQRKIKIGGIAIIILVILNIGMMIFLLTRNEEGLLRPPGPDFIRKKEQNAKAFIIRELDFTPDQIIAFDSLRMQHRQFTREINQENQRLRRQYFDKLLANIPASETEYMAKVIGSNQVELEKGHLPSF